MIGPTRAKAARSRILFALIAFFAAVGAGSGFAEIRPNPNILLINSYSADYRWSAEAYGGIVSELEKSGIDYQLFTEYLDWKRFATEEDLESLRYVYGRRYSKLAIDLIVTVDDAALVFAMENRKAIFSDAPIVFTGVLPESAGQYLAGSERITGVYENVDPAGTLRAAMSINPDLSRVYLFNEDTESGRAIERLMRETINLIAPSLTVHTLSDATRESLDRTVTILPDNSILMVGTCYTELDKQVYAMDVTLKSLAKRCDVPVYVVYRTYLIDGVLGGSLLDPRKMGAATGRLAIAAIRGEVDESAPPKPFVVHRLSFSYPTMNRFGVKASQLPRGAEIVDRPRTFLRQYPLLSIMIGNILLILLSALAALFRNNYRIRRIAYRDELTGLVNQLHVFATTDRLLTRTEGDKKAALFHVDIDDFRLINDVHGHAFGDLVLKEIATRLKTLEGNRARVARFGGDEFLLLALNADPFGIADRARAIQAIFSEGMRINGQDIKLDVTVGIAVYPDHGREFQQLVQNTDMAMHLGKKGGKNRVIFFDFSMARELNAQVELEKSLRKAVENEELSVVFQPQINVATGDLSGFETLVRWNSPKRGSVSPDEFIPIAERSRLIVDIGDYVIRESLWFLKETELMGFSGFTVSVNVSVRQFEDADFPAKLLKTVQTADVAPERLVVEVTESVMIAAMDEVSLRLRSLREAGFRIALDDFGTGYSSLNYLRELPISAVKIDKSFVDTLLTDERSQPLTLHIIGLCHELGLTVVAEGIETAEQRDFLRASACDEIQGFFYSKPLSRDAAYSVLGRNFSDYRTDPPGEAGIPADGKPSGALGEF